eukprot:CAMPEP_0114358860 /NCGR_PEP_ID=MMETSP0101-20121206/22582_1 /TAXON_ID=38822 ORGANISM="Pteridomonas danica, Strain PT" /NCGR_SAMPLE_ID=MMETSP0101 /ASSEMBLY_ACC=CAM_ASM_000211 /LENGTH=267 /DNA_ID=CAMNT_0001502111 /DNA_START=135 /DNA_END=938 /DNA_ORIENTATION=-
MMMSKKNNKAAAEEEDPLEKSPNTAGTSSKCVYAGVCRQQPMKTGGVTLCETFDDSTPTVAAELGRKMLRRKPVPGWDDISSNGWRAIKLPVHDMNGATGYVIVFGGEFDPKRAQATTERFALLIGPMIDGQLSHGEAPHLSKVDVAQADASRSSQDILELHKTMEPMLSREIVHANSMEKIDLLKDHIAEVRGIMENNVNMILDRQELLEDIEGKSSELEGASKIFRKKTRAIRRWHLMNQVKWGVAIGTAVTAAVAIPVVLLVSV